MICRPPGNHVSSRMAFPVYKDAPYLLQKNAAVVFVKSITACVSNGVFSTNSLSEVVSCGTMGKLPWIRLLVVG